MSETGLLHEQEITIVGAGLVGSLMSCVLAKHGARVTVIEKRPDLRHTDLSGGRTIAMSLSHRGWLALRSVGLEESVRTGTKPKHSRCVHLADGTERTQRYGAEGEALWTVNRKDLNCALVDCAEASGRVEFRFETECERLDEADRTLHLQGDGKSSEHTFDYLIASDGMNSAIRRKLVSDAALEDEIITLDYRYFELTVPAKADGTHALPSECVHVWPRPEGLMVALPNLGGTFTGTFFYALGEEDYFGGQLTDEERSRRFRFAFPEIVELIPDFEHELRTNPASDIKAVRCWPWQVSRRVLLVGDACHAIVPFYAMGMNLGFEDVTKFEELLESAGGDLETVFERFPEVRRPDTDAISDLSLQNFVSIGRSTDPEYQQRWELERALWELFPERWTPLYPMIHFGHHPLSDVIRRQAVQKKILHRLMAEGVDATLEATALADAARGAVEAELTRLDSDHRAVG